MTRIRYADISIERGQYGQWICSALVDGYWRSEQFYDYTKRQALRRFHTSING